MRFIGPTFCLITLFFVISFSVPTFGMDFFWKDSQLVLSGEVVKGDGEKFRRFLYVHFDEYKQNRYVRLQSNGGNLYETLRIAAILRSVYPIVWAPKCASSCFFLYLSGIERRYDSSNRIGIHRAYFDPSYFRDLKLEEAKAKLDELTKITDSILEENRVPQHLRDRLNSTSSDEIYWLSVQDAQSIGLMPPWFEELIIAKCDCKDFLASQKDMYYQRPDNPDHPFDPEKVANSFLHCSTCVGDMIAEQLSRMPQALLGGPTPKAASKAIKQ